MIRIAILVALAATLMTAGIAAFARGDAAADESIDLSGDWEIELHGSVEGLCLATIGQIDGDIEMQVECLSTFSGILTGNLDKSTGELSASGVLFYPVNIVALVSLDGEAMSGYWNMETLQFDGTFTGARAGVHVTPTPLPTLPAPVDATGTWTIDFASILSGQCVSIIEQTGTALSSIADCDILGFLQLTGTIDPATGVFAMSDSSGIELQGVVAPGGDYFSGTFIAFGLAGGTLTGVRSQPVGLIDLSGEWELLITGDASGACAAQIDHHLGVATVELDCGALGAFEMEGSANPFSGNLFLHQFDADEMRVNNELSLLRRDDGLLTGYWYNREGMNSSVVAAPPGSFANGVVAIDCYPQSPSIELSCGRGIVEDSSSQPIALHVIAPPAAGYQGLQAHLAWDSAVAAYVAAPIESEVAAPICAGMTRATLVGGMRYGCEPSEAELTEYTGDVIELALDCVGEGQTMLNLVSEGSYFIDSGGASVMPLLIGASFECYETDEDSEPLYPGGDANCSETTDAVDAAVILQFDAAMLAFVPCPFAADVNGDELINSIDASLVLQRAAGLLP